MSHGFDTTNACLYFNSSALYLQQYNYNQDQCGTVGVACRGGQKEFKTTLNVLDLSLSALVTLIMKWLLPVGIWCNYSPAGNPQSFPGWALSIPPGPSKNSNNVLSECKGQ